VKTQAVAPPAELLQTVAVRPNGRGIPSAPAPESDAPSASRPEVPLMRDRDGRVIDAQICTTPASKPRRMLVAAAQP
jgi:hypothetical protein